MRKALKRLFSISLSIVLVYIAAYAMLEVVDRPPVREKFKDNLIYETIMGFSLVVVFVPLWLRTTLPHPSDEKMMKHFDRHKQDYETLIKMILEDKAKVSADLPLINEQYIYIGHRLAVPVNRVHEYERLLKKVKHGNQGFLIPEDSKYDPIGFEFHYRRDLNGRVSQKGYYWFPFLAKEVQENNLAIAKEDFEPGSQYTTRYHPHYTYFLSENLDALYSATSRFYKWASNPKRNIRSDNSEWMWELTAIRPIEGNWYLYLKQSGRDDWN